METMPAVRVVIGAVAVLWRNRRDRRQDGAGAAAHAGPAADLRPSTRPNSNKESNDDNPSIDDT